jgi:hypothetical protein
MTVVEQSQLRHVSSLIETANKLGVKTYIAGSHEQLWTDKKYDEFLDTV